VFVFDDDEGNRVINPLTAAEVDTYVRQIQTRLQRLRTLAELLPEVAPAFCLVQSSMGAITGDKRNMIGAAVGTFAAVLTQWQTYHNPGTWINVNWEHWSRTPDEPTTLTLEEGIVALTQILGWGVSAQVVVSPNEFAIRSGARPQRQEALVAELPASSAPLLNIRPLPSSYVAPRNDLEWMLAEIWCSVLGIDRISVHDDFADVGGNSVICIEVAARIRERGLKVNPRDLRDNATIAKLAVTLQPPVQTETRSDQAVDV
jgi:aryl carrier-like protein